MHGYHVRCTWGDKCVSSTDISQEKFDRVVDIICKKIKKVYLPKQIVIHKHYYADGYIDEQGLHRYGRKSPTENDKTLKLIKHIESLMEEKLKGCHIIEFPDYVLGAAKHVFGVCSLHYHSLYYEYVREALEIIFQHSSDEKILLSHLRDNYSMQFKMMRMELLGEIKNRIIEKEIDNIIRLEKYGNKSPRVEDISQLLLDQDYIYGYLDVLYMLRDKISVLIAVRDTSGGGVEDNFLLRKLKRLGFYKYPAKLWRMYVGIIFRGTVLVDYAPDKARDAAIIEHKIGDLEIKLQSEAYPDGDKAVIEINGNDYAKNKRGINIVVCNATDGKVLDSISYDMYNMDRFAR